jgi:hypothetical protein
MKIMKMSIFKLVIVIAVISLIASCEKNNQNPLNEYGSNYIINYGDYGKGKSEISLFKATDSTVISDYYKSANGISPVSNIQYAYQTNGKIYFMGNNPDQVFYVDENTFEQTANAISGSNLIKPRYCVAFNNILYVSCWGGDIWNDVSVSYIAKIDLSNHTIIGKIPLPGGPEGLAIANGKLYAALNYEKKIAVINLSTENITYINTPAASSFFIQEKSGHLFVSLVSTYSTPADKQGIGHINTLTDQITVYELEGISSAYVNMMAFNIEQTILYVMTSAYDVNWNLKGAIAMFNTTLKTFDTHLFVENVQGLNGIAVNQQNNDIYYFISNSASSNGKMVHLSPAGALLKNYNTGIEPFMMLNVIDNSPQ